MKRQNATFVTSHFCCVFIILKTTTVLFHAWSTQDRNIKGLKKKNLNKHTTANFWHKCLCLGNEQLWDTDIEDQMEGRSNLSVLFLLCYLTSMKATYQFDFTLSDLFMQDSLGHMLGQHCPGGAMGREQAKLTGGQYTGRQRTMELSHVQFRQGL